MRSLNPIRKARRSTTLEAVAGVTDGLIRRPSIRWPSRQSRGGFVLLMSLVLILLAALLLAGLARYSLTIALESSDAKQELQRRWGAVLLEKVLASRAPEIMARYEARTPRQVANAARLYPLVETVRLGGIHFRLLLDDETRKLNLSRLYVEGGEDRVIEALRDLGVARSAVRLRPGEAAGPVHSARVFGSWGQVFQLDALPMQEHPSSWLVREASDVTCWGDGRAHYAKASDRVLETLCRQITGPTTSVRLLALRTQNPGIGLDELLDRLAVSWRERNKLKGWLTDQSDCYAIWIIGEANGRSWPELHVAEVAPDGSVRMHHFVW